MARRGQFRGGFRLITWNAQAFFSSDPAKAAAKQRWARSLLNRCDLLLITEAHGTPGIHKAWRPPLGHSAWWSAGASTAHAGVGIIANNKFLSQFNSVIWRVIWPGRLARLMLRGADGALDVYVAYAHSGAMVGEAELHGLPASQWHRCTTFPELRNACRCRLARAIAHRHSVLTIVGGDWNWVVEHADRQTLAAAAPSLRNDASEETHFQSQVALPNGLAEMHQPELTHASATSRARLDRFYSNQPVTEQLDRNTSNQRGGWSHSMAFNDIQQLILLTLIHFWSEFYFVIAENGDYLKF